jgi:hypothetical protein
MPRSANSYTVQENIRKREERKQRQDAQAIESVAAMADYRRAADRKLQRMIVLRTARLKRQVGAK